MNFGDIKTSVQELLDNRTFSAAKHQRWIRRVRDSVAMSFPIAGFKGLYFLYKEATVTDGSVANQSKYAVPSDFIDDLNVFYAGNLLAKAPPGMIDITLEQDDTATTPKLVRLLGTEFDIRPIPTVAGDEIKLLYNGMPDVITADATEDYFMKRFPDLHIFGMAWHAAKHLVDSKLAAEYKGDFNEQKIALTLHNRRHYIKNARIRFQTWDEYEDKKTIIFPQYGNF